VEGAAHHYTQLAEVQSESQLVRGLFDHILVFQNYPVQEIAASGADGTEKTEKLSLLSFTRFDQSSYNLLFTVFPDEEMMMKFDYNASVYDPNQVERLRRHVVQLITSIVNNPLSVIGNLEYISGEEKMELLGTRNDTSATYSCKHSILELFDKQVMLHPQRTAVLMQDKKLSYQELDEKANQLAHYLIQEHGIKTNDLVGIMLDRSEKAIIAILGILKAGAAYVPVDPQYPDERKTYIIKDSAISLLITQTDYLFDIGYYQGPVFGMDVQMDIIATPVTKPVVLSSYTDTAYVIYTSGSTGQPKGCAVTHGNLANYIQWAGNYYFGDTDSSDFGLFTSLSFDLTITAVFCSLTRGGRLYVYPQQEEILKVLLHSFSNESGINVIKLTPSHINILDGLNISSATMMRVIVGGEQLTAAQVNTLKQINPAIIIYNEYGPTETTVGCTVARIEAGDPIIIGKPVANTQVYVLDNNLMPCGAGAAGEIYVAGAGVSKGYLNKPELTAEKFIPDPFNEGQLMYRTGDMGRWLFDGNLEFTGRRDDQVKIRGYRIEPGEIETVMMNQSVVEKAHVIADKDAEGEMFLTAYFVAEGSVETGELKNQLSKILPSYMLPSFFIQVETFPLTINGKVDKKLLPPPSGLGFNSGTEYVPPRNEIEEKLAELWKGILGKEKIGIEDNFFDAGGNSIKIIRLASVAGKLLDRDISVGLLFQYSTIKALVDHLMEEPVYHEDEVFDREGFLDDLNKFD
jgi:amino acid adenylation domain-containing protein